MIFNPHSNLVGMHAQLSASKYHWLRYDDEKFLTWFENAEKAAEGSRLHDLAMRLIRERVKLPNSNKTLNMYVNDAIGYRMTPEQPLFVNPVCFGTPDAISFSERKQILRISDLKTGLTKASFDQLLIYAAMFCIEYNFEPFELEKIEMRIYQSDEKFLEEADPEIVKSIMNLILLRSEQILTWREEALR